MQKHCKGRESKVSHFKDTFKGFNGVKMHSNIASSYPRLQGLSDSSVGEEAAMRQETPVWSLGQEDPLEEEMAVCSDILAWTILRDRGSLAGYSV